MATLRCGTVALMETAIWLKHEFVVYLPTTTWHDVGGVYIFARPDPVGWRAVYVGRTRSFADRLANTLAAHDRWTEAQSLGATHVHARVVGQEDARRALEEALIHVYRPRLNAQHVR